MRNRSEDWTKLFLSLLVVTIHVFPINNTPGVKGVLYYLCGNGIARTAVPLFFVFSGYRIPDDFSFGAFRKRAGHLVRLFIVWQAVYIYFPISAFISNHSISGLIENLLHGYWHIWYLAASISSLTILFLLKKRFGNAAILIISAALYLFGYVWQLLINLGVFDEIEVVRKIYSFVGTSRTGLFFGLFYIALGMNVGRWEKLVKAKAVLLLMVSLALMLAEALVYKSILSGSMDLFIFTIPVAACSLYIVKANPDRIGWGIDPSISLGIYLLHLLPILIINHLGIVFLAPLKYLVVVSLSLALFVPFNQANKQTKLFF